MFPANTQIKLRLVQRHWRSRRAAAVMLAVANTGLGNRREQLERAKSKNPKEALPEVAGFRDEVSE
jgi:hypothetical protein